MHFDIPHFRLEDDPSRPFYTTIRTKLIIAASIIAIVVFFVGVWISLAPKAFPVNSLVTIPAEATGAEFAHLLKESNIIRSETAFRALARITGYDSHLNPGTYAFTEPISIYSVLYRIGNGRHGIEEIRVTLTEGMTRFDMAETFERELPGFDSTQFLDLASTSEGYLFPETYQFMPGTPASDIVTRLKSQFSLSISTITPEILSSKRSFSDAVIMASILEREANTEEDKHIVAGILWNRIAIDMPLQVDAVFGYIHQENGYTPTAADLAMESPYNTYRNTGLPPTPISNPGLESLLAAVTPAETPYYYYLTGRDGLMHYARTFEEHKQNRVLYLD
jgi:UPF0755 protein